MNKIKNEKTGEPTTRIEPKRYEEAFKRMRPREHRLTRTARVLNRER